MPKLDKIPYAKNPTTVKNNDFWYNWCCDCGLRHIYFVRVVRGKTPKQDKVEMFICRDDLATDNMKSVETLEAENKKLRAKIRKRGR